MPTQPKPDTIDEYIAAFPPKVRAILKRIRATVREAAPDATEKISYRMPAFFQGGVLVYFAAFQKHIGLFPPVRGDEKLLKQAAPFMGPKGNLQFPLDKPIPYALIGRIVKFRLNERLASGRPRKKR
ncbi:MAG: iron chaperone [Gemmataceae bacterium]